MVGGLVLKLRGLFKNPKRIPTVVACYSKGYYYRLKFRLLGKNIKIGRGFRVRGKLVIGGPGRVIIGDGVAIENWDTPKVFIYTFDKEAIVEIGDNTFLNGTKIESKKSVKIGNYCVIADAHIVDTNFHSIAADRATNLDAYVSNNPIVIGDNVWIASQAKVLSGSRIGKGSVIGTLSVVSGEIPEDVVAAGNPVRIVKRIK